MITKERGKLRCREDESIKHRHATYTKTIFFLDGWLEMRHQVNVVCIFVKEKGHLLSKDARENIIQ